MEGKTARDQGWTRELLMRLVDSVDAYGIFASDTDGNVVSWNAGAERLFGYTAEEIIGQHNRILFTEEDQMVGVPESELQTAREDGHAKDERWHLRKDGSLFFSSGIQTAFFDENGKVNGYAKIVRDLTNRVEMEDRLHALDQDFEIKVVERTGELEKSNEELKREVEKRIRSEELRRALTRKIVSTQEKERKRIARDLHDMVGQQMTALKLKLGRLAGRTDVPHDVMEQILELQIAANRIDNDVDFLGWELRPSVLDDLGLVEATANYVRDWSLHFEVPADFKDVGMDSKRFLPEIETNLYRIAQEALNNTAKHADAKSASVLLEKIGEEIRLIVEDEGAGFDAERMQVDKVTDRGMGLIGMKERAELLGGSFEIESSRGVGTTIFVRVPAAYPEGKTAGSTSDFGAGESQVDERDPGDEPGSGDAG